MQKIGQDHPIIIQRLEKWRSIDEKRVTLENRPSTEESQSKRIKQSMDLNRKSWILKDHSQQDHDQ